MGHWISLIASFMIGGLVLLSFGRFSGDVNRDMYRDTLDHAAYGNLENLVRLIEYDFSRIGLRVNDPVQPLLLQADSTELRYVMDSDGDGAIETVRYFLSDAGAASFTLNPNDRILYRSVNGGTAEVLSAGLTAFRIRYYDSLGNETMVLSDIRTFAVSLTLESEYSDEAQPPRMFWTGRVTPPAMFTR